MIVPLLCHTKLLVVNGYGIVFLVGGCFRAVQAPFWGNPGVKCGEMQVSCGLDRKNCRKKHVSRSFLFSVCVLTHVCVCVCVCL